MYLFIILLTESAGIYLAGIQEWKFEFLDLINFLLTKVEFRDLFKVKLYYELIE
jgi:hypothetical protein